MLYYRFFFFQEFTIRIYIYFFGINLNKSLECIYATVFLKIFNNLNFKNPTRTRKFHFKSPEPARIIFGDTNPTNFEPRNISTERKFKGNFQ